MALQAASAPEGASRPRSAVRSYKTALCRSFATRRGCKYGDGCRFAHGDDELRVRLNPPRYKTVPCRNEAQGRVCPYGAKCDYIHASDSAPSQPPAADAAWIGRAARSAPLSPSAGRSVWEPPPLLPSSPPPPAPLPSLLLPSAGSRKALPANTPAALAGAAAPVAACDPSTAIDLFASFRLPGAPLLDAYYAAPHRCPAEPSWPSAHIDRASRPGQAIARTYSGLFASPSRPPL
ncbi:hypothetical protein H4R18_002196 [Coemansia javaensis]|uniref:C3H1-type domain-containing protein n=1 Tax=Coemansia javaensis TaxID=2761396 RepID=A0A9W8HCM5_9FUNG|nr:hypothetical protein H4R18_002196 [Coemansia javaensis]